MGENFNRIQLLVIVLTPIKEKDVKNDVGLSTSIATILSSSMLRNKLLHEVNTEDNFRSTLKDQATNLRLSHRHEHKKSLTVAEANKQPFVYDKKSCCGNGIRNDINRRKKYYKSDFSDAFKSKKIFLKVFTTIWFLYFANLLPTLAFGALNSSNTEGTISTLQGILSQFIGGFLYAFFTGQPLNVVLTTAPISILIQVIFTISKSNSLDFRSMFACVGIFNCVFIWIYAVFDLSRFMRYSTRSTEEIFGTFISIAFIVDSVKACVKNFQTYFIGHCPIDDSGNLFCNKEASLLFFILMVGTVLVGMWLYNFKNTPFLNAPKREFLSDFALPVSVILMSFVGSFLFQRVRVAMSTESWDSGITSAFLLPSMNLPWYGYLIAVALAFPLSVLFFMDHNIVASVVQNPSNKLKKGTAYHWDLIVISTINVVLSIFGLPWMHGALPHAPLHVRALAVVEEHVDQNYHITERVISVTETRITTLVANIMIGASIFMLPMPLKYLPVPVLYGLFLFMAFTALYGNQFVERLLLFITEQSAYPPNHYLRRVPQKKVHIFTILQLVQLLILCAAGFVPNPYVKMVFPVLLIIQLPVRHGLIPKIIRPDYLNAMDKSI